MELRLFAHSWLSDWNHGNAHFLRGLAAALVARGHRVRVYEELTTPSGGWSLHNLLRDHAPQAPAWLAAFRRAFPQLRHSFYHAPARNRAADAAPALAPELLAAGFQLTANLDDELRAATHVIVHEWNEPHLFDYLVERRQRLGFRLLLLDTHHRLLSHPAAVAGFRLRSLDAVLAFGESLRRLYETQTPARRTYTLHEAADVTHFAPPSHPPQAAAPGLVWIGNWGDDERTQALEEYLMTPAATVTTAGGRAQVYGVRYPNAALQRLLACGIVYGGFLPNLAAPQAYASAGITVHIPRQPYAASSGPRLPGIPTIRVFEALACGAALLCAPWDDCERLFRPGQDFWSARNGAELSEMLMQLLRNPEQRMRLGRSGWETIQARHTCAHRAAELEDICRDLD